MSTLNDWDTAPSPAGDPTLHAHKIGLHDVPEDECPACRVDRGAALLDERRPGWWEDVDVERLDMETTCMCVLGQVFGGYYQGIDHLFWLDEDANPVEYGFDADGGYEYPQLRELWRSRISERRAR